MSEPRDVVQGRLERRSLELFNDSVHGLDMPTCSRLNRARHAALDAVAASRRRPWISRPVLWAPVGGMVAAAVLGVTLWSGVAAPDNPPGLEDLDIVASSDGSGDALDMLQDELDFYDFTDGAVGSGPAV